MTKDVLTVRDVDEATWRKFRAKTEEEGIRTGQALSQALNFWIREKERSRKRPDPRNFLKVGGIIKAGRLVRWSEEIDKALYGEEK